MTRTEASRINGAKSNGPVTLEGKARSSRNAATHGFYSDQVVIAGESQEEFDIHLAGYIDRYQPGGSYEHQLVADLAAIRWRLRRIVAMETAVLNTEIARLAASEEHAGAPAALIQALAFSNLVRGPELNRLHRFESRLRRSFDETEVGLFAAQQDRLSRDPEPEIQKMPNEPSEAELDTPENAIAACRHLIAETNPSPSERRFLDACIDALNTIEKAPAAPPKARTAA